MSMELEARTTPMEFEARSPRTATQPAPALISEFLAFQKALVPLDGSVVAEAILPYVVKIAHGLDIELLLIRVVPPIALPVMEGQLAVAAETEAPRQEAEQYLLGLANSLRSKGMRIETIVRLGDPAIEIVGTAREASVDLIAMTTHGRSGISRLLFGSVAEAVLRRAQVPLLLLPLREAEVAAPAA
jgi:nucleotide-binding universal stress UspA family protein